MTKTSTAFVCAFTLLVAAHANAATYTARFDQSPSTTHWSENGTNFAISQGTFVDGAYHVATDGASESMAAALSVDVGFDLHGFSYHLQGTNVTVHAYRGASLRATFSLTPTGPGFVLHTPDGVTDVDRLTFEAEGGGATSLYIDDLVYTTRAPTFTSPPAIVNDSVNLTSVDLMAVIDQQGMIAYVVLPRGAPAPSALQVAIGVDVADEAVPTTGNVATAAGAVWSQRIEGLSPSNGYDIYLVAYNNAMDLQPAPVLVQIDTLPIVTAPPADIVPAPTPSTEVAQESQGRGPGQGTPAVYTSEDVMATSGCSVGGRGRNAPWFLALPLLFFIVRRRLAR